MSDDAKTKGNGTEDDAYRTKTKDIFISSFMSLLGVTTETTVADYFRYVECGTLDEDQILALHKYSDMTLVELTFEATLDEEDGEFEEALRALIDIKRPPLNCLKALWRLCTEAANFAEALEDGDRNCDQPTLKDALEAL